MDESRADADASVVLRMRSCGTPTMFGDIADRRVVFVIEASARASAVLPAVKDDLVEAVLRLAYRGDGQTYFNLVEFGGSEVVQWSDRMVLATPQTATVAAHWIRSLMPTEPARGASAGLLGALLAAMAEPACQAVYLVTTTTTAGVSGGAATLLGTLGRRLGGEARLRPVHCVQCETAAANEAATLDFLCDLAAGTGGSVADVRVGVDAHVESMTRVLTADRPSARRLVRGADGRLRNQAVVPWPLVPAAPAPVATTTSTALVPLGSGPGATLIHRNVLVRRKQDGVYYRGHVTSQVASDVFLVEIPAHASCPSAEAVHQQTPIADLVSLDDALGRPVGPGDFVLVPSGAADGYWPARVLRGSERRAAARDHREADSAQLTVEMTAAGQPEDPPHLRTLDPGLAVWIPRELHCRLEYEAAAAAAAAKPKMETEPTDEASPEVKDSPPAATEPPPIAAVDNKAPAEEEMPERTATPPPPPVPEAMDSDNDFDDFGDRDDWRLPQPPPPPNSVAPRLCQRRRSPRSRRRLPQPEVDEQTSRVEAYRQAMEATRREEICRRRAELEADGILRDARLRRSEEVTIERQLRAEEAALRGRGALHTAAVIEARLRRQERREVEELQLAQAEAERVRLRWRRDGGDGELLAATPEVLRLRRLRLMAEDDKRRLADAEVQAQCAKPDRTIAEWLLHQRLAAGGRPPPPQPQQAEPPRRPPLTAQERQRLTRRAQTTGP